MKAAKKRASGGKVDLVSGNPNVIAEARAALGVSPLPMVINPFTFPEAK